MKPKVFIDTNIINSSSLSGPFFGQNKKLQELKKRADIIIPEIVKREILEHKRNNFEEKKSQLLGNELLPRIVKNIDDVDKTLRFDMEYCSSSNDFETVSIRDGDGFLKWAIPLALKHQAPFDSKTDKGFKDAIIAFCINEYLEHNPEIRKPVVLVSNDARLGEYFQNRENTVCVVKSFEELDEYLGQNSLTASRPGPGMNYFTQNGNLSAPSSYLLKARKLLTELRNSPNFASTHKIIAELAPYRQYLRKEDFIDILQSALDNDQIMWVSQDEDVMRFLKPIFDEYGNKLNLDQYNDFVNRTQWPGYRLKEPVFQE